MITGYRSETRSSAGAAFSDDRLVAGMSILTMVLKGSKVLCGKMERHHGLIKILKTEIEVDEGI
jgi:hypothetical protein